MRCERAMSTTPAMTSPRGRVSLSLTREVTCIRSLAWRCDLPIATDWGALATALEAAGFVPRPAVGTMLRFATATGDELAAVPITGRVQLRVHYTVPEHDRRFAAERLFQQLVHAVLRT